MRMVVKLNGVYPDIAWPKTIIIYAERYKSVLIIKMPPKWDINTLTCNGSEFIINKPVISDSSDCVLGRSCGYREWDPLYLSTRLITAYVAIIGAEFEMKGNAISPNHSIIQSITFKQRGYDTVVVDNIATGDDCIRLLIGEVEKERERLVERDKTCEELRDKLISRRY